MKKARDMYIESDIYSFNIVLLFYAGLRPMNQTIGGLQYNNCFKSLQTHTEHASFIRLQSPLES